MTKITISIDTDSNEPKVTPTVSNPTINVGKAEPIKEEKKEGAPLEKESTKEEFFE